MSNQDLSININSDIVLTLLHQKLINTTNELKQKTTELEQKTAEYNQLVAENNRQKATIESNEKLIAELQAENEQLKAEIATLTAKVAQLEADNKELKEKYETLKVEHKTLKQEHETLKVEHNTLRTEFNESKRLHFQLKLKTAIQDLNAYDMLETKFENPIRDQLKQLREERNDMNHYVQKEYNPNRINYRLSVLKNKMENMNEEDISYFNFNCEGEGNLHSAILAYLNTKIINGLTASRSDIQNTNMWWN